ncbi:MAG: helix-turn-helix transcriptional regulator [Bacteroidota bacterium]
MCKKMGFSQQKFADKLGVPRGKVSGYFYKTQAKPDFQKKIAEAFNLDWGRYLTIKMNDFNFESFFLISDSHVKEPEPFYHNSGILNVLIRAKNSEDKHERDQLIDEAISLAGRLMEESSRLNNELVKAMRKKE